MIAGQWVVCLGRTADVLLAEGVLAACVERVCQPCADGPRDDQCPDAQYLGVGATVADQVAAVAVYDRSCRPLSTDVLAGTSTLYRAFMA